jgi:glycosyltransferase involved in cell wall biosynthesis
MCHQGWKWDAIFPSVSYLFSTGFFRPACKNILRLDGLYFDSKNTLGSSDRLNKPIFRAYGKADGIIFQSDFSRHIFNVFAGEPKCPTVTIHNGISSDFASHGPRLDFDFEKTLACSARWTAVKRLDSIVEGFLEYGCPNTGLLILGGRTGERYDHPNIIYTGEVSPSDLPKYLRAADAFIHLSWFDSCPNTVVEALACGLPVLCSHNGGTRELVGDNGIVVKLEEDYQFDRVDIFKPPKCDVRQVASGIEKILAWKKPIECDYLEIGHTATKYMEMAESI